MTSYSSLASAMRPATQPTMDAPAPPATPYTPTHHVSTVLPSPPDSPFSSVPSPELKSSDTASPLLFKLRSLKGKEREVSMKRPLRLLDLPVDILREIIGHIPHANDLTSLALSHSVLHSLAIPCIYSRFDIVWPDQGMQTESRAGVDALTYGLATLVKAQELFGEAAFQRQQTKKRSSTYPDNPYPLRRRRLGNYYAQYTKKFSLGNGPADCVREYLITKEGGKMLGTLVALAVARMPNLENFVWDMPTGVLRDVWLALSSLADRDDDEECRLEKVWVRWHNNWQTDISDVPPPPPPNVPPPNVGHHNNSNNNAHGTNTAISAEMSSIPVAERVEHPSFSVLPPLKSLTVLEIDELAYLDEMSILIARSQHRLKELRVGIARHARGMPWNVNWDGEDYHQVDHSTTWTIASKIGDKRLQGVLGVLIGRIHNLRNNVETSRTEFGMDFIAKVLERQQKPEDERSSHVSSDTTDRHESGFGTSREELGPTEGSLPPDTPHRSSRANTLNSVASNSSSSADETFSTPLATRITEPTEPNPPHTLHPSTKVIPLRPARPLRTDAERTEKDGPYLSNQLRLDTLELERVPLSLPVLRQAIDFTTITTLALLNCQGHDRLWKLLRSRYGPLGRRGSAAYRLPTGSNLSLKKIHTDTVSSHLLHFVRDTLRPNSLETLFLQDRWGSRIKVGAVFRHAVRRHRGSLKRLLIDSGQLEEVFAEPNSRWRNWLLSRKQVAYLTSGRMSSLRELAVSIEYSDWHVFLQRLPRIPHLRSLYIPHIADHPYGSNIDTHDLALQILDIVVLRPEIQLCYMGLGSKCFEILENRPLPASANDSTNSSPRSLRIDAGRSAREEDNDSDSVSGESGDETFDVETSDEDDLDNTVDESDSGTDEEDGGAAFRRKKANPALRLQEILFYDKISIFKARYGRL